MLEAIRSFFRRRIASGAGGAESAEDGETGEPGEAGQAAVGVRIAAAALLLELAHADGEFGPAERAHIEGAVGRHFGLDEATAAELLRLAERERNEAIDHFQFTRAISEQYDLGQKMVLAEVMWGVILADGTIGEHESYLVRKIANLLNLEPGYLAQARRAATPRGESPTG